MYDNPELLLEQLDESDKAVVADLAKKVWFKAAEIKIKEGWRIPQGKELLRKMSVLALYEIANPYSMSLENQAVLCGVSKSSWRQTWQERYFKIKSVAQDMVNKKIASVRN